MAKNSPMKSMPKKSMPKHGGSGKKYPVKGEDGNC